MKNIAVFLILLGSALSTCYTQAFSQVAFADIDGQEVAPAAFRGKKVLFLIIPVTGHDSLVAAIADLKENYGDVLEIVGIPSMEDGYDTSATAQVKSRYSGRAAIVLAKGGYTRKSAGAQQLPLLQWLTDQGKNKISNREVDGIGAKFFLDETGRLFGVLSSRVPLRSPVIASIIRTPPAGQQQP